MRRRRTLLLGLALLVLLPLLALGWLLGSGSGRDLSVAQLVARLPDGALSIGSTEGRLAGPLVLRDVRYRADGVEISASRVALQYGLPALVARRLRLQSAIVDELLITLPPAPAEPEPIRIELPQQLPWPTLRLPFDLQVDALRINGARVQRDGESLLDLASLDLTARLSRDGSLQVDALQATAAAGVLRGRGSLGLAGAPAGDFSADWTPVGEPVAAATLRLRSAGDALEISLALDASGEATLAVDRAMAWRLQVDLEGFDPARWGLGQAPQSVALKLAAQGDSVSATFAGRLADAARSLGFENARVRLVDQGGTLQIESLRLLPDTGGGIDLLGAIAFSAGLDLDLTATAAELPLPLGEGEPAEFDGQLRLRGPLSALAIELAPGRLRRAGMSAEARFAGELQPSGLRIDAASLESAGSALGIVGRLDWDHGLRADLALELKNFDPAIFAADLSGKIDGALRLVGDLDPKQPDWRLDIERLAGEFRQRPLAGQGHLAWRGDGGEADLDLRLGGSRLRMRGLPGEQLDLAVEMSPLLLADLLPGAGGQLSGSLRLRGAPENLRVSGRLQGVGLAYEEYEIAELSLDVDGALGGAEAGRLSLQGRSLTLGELAFDGFQLALSGTRAAHALELSANGERLSFDAKASGGLQGDDWRGRLEALGLRPGAAPAWRLRTPAALAWVQVAATLVDACLVGEGEAEVCLDLAGNGGAQTLAARLRAIELQTLAALAGAKGLQVGGIVEGELRLARRGEAPFEGGFALRLPEGSLSETATPDRTLLRWRELLLELDLAATTAELRVNGRLDDEGRIEGTLSGGSPLADPDASLGGSLRVNLPGLAALELILPELVDTRGTLLAELQLSGRWRDPQVAGSVELQGLGAEVPALGIRLRDSLLVLRSDGSRVEVDGLIDSGTGKLRLDGSLEDAFGEAGRGRLQLRGERVRVADTPFVRALVSPDLTLVWRNRRLQVSGRVAVPEAALDLEHLDGSLGTSPDVVVLDPREDSRVTGRLPLTARIEVELGDKVTLKGLGFDGGVSGTLQISERSGRPTTGRGSLEVRGNYRAYGQDLEIQRGRLLFAASPLDDPGLDVRAQREVDSTTVGIQVSGTAQRPLLSVWSNPALDEAEALSYLVLGRPLRSATSAEGAQLGQAAAALGGNLLAGRVGERMGFDTFGVADSQALGGAAFTVGKYLSPALYLSYGVSLFGRGQVITLRYLLTEHLDIEIETGSESRAGLNYSIER